MAVLTVPSCVYMLALSTLLNTFTATHSDTATIGTTRLFETTTRVAASRSTVRQTTSTMSASTSTMPASTSTMPVTSTLALTSGSVVTVQAKNETSQAITATTTPIITTLGRDNTSITSAPLSVTDDDSNNYIAFVVIPIAVVAIVVMVIAVILIKRRRSRQKQGSGAQLSAIVSLAAENGSTPHNGFLLPSPSRDLLTMIPLSDIIPCIERLRSEDDGFRKQFLTLPHGLQSAMKRHERLKTGTKDRYRNIRPYDHSIVVLSKIENEVDSDYINANYIDGYMQPKRFIATQGPNSFTVPDFWRMVWEQGTTRIVMLANLIEAGREKCTQYWPDKGSKSFGDLTVTLEEEEVSTHYCIRTFSVKQLSSEPERRVTQFHYTSWPDESVPVGDWSLLAFQAQVNSQHDDNPIVIHCSAGVGRTGTYIGVEWLLCQLKQQTEVNVWRCVSDMRSQRATMVQSVDQYTFLYHTLLESVLPGGTTSRCADFAQTYDVWRKTDKGGKTALDTQFTVLHSVFKPRLSEYVCNAAAMAHNFDKNRLATVLPADNRRPFLTNRGGELTSDYINAVCLRECRWPAMIFITQTPLRHTQIDFWRLTHDFECDTIVMLNEMETTEKGASASYLPPAGQTKTVGPFCIESKTAQTTNGLVTTTCKLMFDSKTSMVEHIRVADWGEGDALPSCLATLTAVIERVYSRATQSGRATIIQCTDGESRSGLFCALLLLWRRMKDDLVVDVFNVVRLIRTVRPGFIADQEQYKCLYRYAEESTTQSPTSHL